MTKIRCFVSIFPAFLLVISVGLLAVSSAHATTATAADGGVVWCNGYLPPASTLAAINAYVYPTIPLSSADTAPDGLAANPNNVPDAWQKNPAIDNPAPASGAAANPNGLYPVNLNDFGFTAETVVPAAPASPDDRYAMQLDYWNSVASGLAIDAWDTATVAINGTTTAGSLGYSYGNSCVLVYPGGSNAGQFTITYPATPSLTQAKLLANFGVTNTTQPTSVPTEAQWAQLYQNSYEPPYIYGATAGGPTGYISTFKGCAWDANSCTEGSAVLTAANPTPAPTTDLNAFPQVLSNITSIPTTWGITSDPNYGTPFVDNGSNIWDASYDIWFDTTGQTGVGKGPGQYGTSRGQNDGLEIMVWMNSLHSYVDAPGSPTPNATGYAQPSGWPREQVLINNVVYDVWTSRLNNPYFGANSPNATYSHINVVPGGQEPYTCNTLATYWNTTTAAVGTNTTSVTCGTEWNVVSFVATKVKDANGNYTDYRKTSMSMDTKVFTDYILGIPDGLWQTVSAPTAGDRVDIGITSPNGVLSCPASSMDGQQTNPPTNPNACLSQSWLLTSVDAGFEPWAGGNGLESQSFVAHVNTHSTAVQTGAMTATGQPIVYWGSPFDIVYSGCASNAAPNTASFTISGFYNPTAGTSTSTPITWPASGVPVNMTADLGSPNLFEYSVPAMSPMHGTATINFTSSCGNYSVSIFIDPSGQVSAPTARLQYRVPQ